MEGCQFLETVYYKREKAAHSKMLCILTGQSCISEELKCERHEYAVSKGVTRAYIDGQEEVRKEKARLARRDKPTKKQRRG